MTDIVPVATAHVGWIRVRTGGVGVVGCGFIVTLVGVELQPAALVTVKLYVPATRPDMVVVTPVPAMAPGLIVQLPAGKLFRITLPVEVEQLGCVTAPSVGGVGV